MSGGAWPAVRCGTASSASGGRSRNEKRSAQQGQTCQGRCTPDLDGAGLSAAGGADRHLAARARPVPLRARAGRGPGDRPYADPGGAAAAGARRAGEDLAAQGDSRLRDRSQEAAARARGAARAGAAARPPRRPARQRGAAGPVSPDRRRHGLRRQEQRRHRVHAALPRVQPADVGGRPQRLRGARHAPAARPLAPLLVPALQGGRRPAAVRTPARRAGPRHCRRRGEVRRGSHGSSDRLHRNLHPGDGWAMKTYRGTRSIDGLVVTVDGRPLGEHYEVERFTKWGFEWTYEGASPQQLALALLYDHTGDRERAIRLCEPFMKKVVANLDNDWTLSGGDIDRALEEIEAR